MFWGWHWYTRCSRSKLIIQVLSNIFWGPYFTQDYESDEKFCIPDDRISHLLPTSYQDKIVRVYAKKPELVYLYQIKLSSILTEYFRFNSPFSLSQWTGWSNLWGFWKFPIKDIWNQSTSSRNTREKETAYVREHTIGDCIFTLLVVLKKETRERERERERFRTT